MKALRRFTVRAHLPERLAALEELSVNLRWSWHKPTQELFAAVDPALWAQVGADPVALLGAVNPRRLDDLAGDEGFLQRVDSLAAELADYLGRPLWYQEQAADGVELPNGIAYFSMEFGVAEVLPNYSGGLGILAGDHLKSASDLGLPLIAVGLYYRSGYFRQSLTADGWQHETYPSLDPAGAAVATADRRRRRCGAHRVGDARRCAAVRTCLGGAGGPNPVAVAGFRHRRERARVARGDRSALRRRSGAPDQTGDPGRDRRHPGHPGVHRGGGAAGTGGVPHERGACRLPRCRAHPRTHRRRTGLRHRADRGPFVHGVHHAHTGARGDRPIPGGDDPALFRRWRPRDEHGPAGSCCPECRWTG